MSPSPAVTADLAHDLRLATMRLARRLRQQRADHGIPLGQISVLATLDRLGPLTPGALAQHEQVRPPTMTKVLANLAEAGLVDRVADPADGRQQLVSLTPKAAKMLREDRRRRDEWLATHLVGLTSQQREALAAALPVLEVLADS
ncbi:MarR family winged helix-turn-helix transcriptional regulator [Longivirga aurantiaca]|uniref:MarR family winged helix-turn-helix transcriptional regulator n=1 Tax=Longivirga aurantiaca TaxID=1837743 RepID=A0ABW1T4U0_9ACTN